MAPDALELLSARVDRAKARRAPWEPLWQECYGFALPQRAGGLGPGATTRLADRLFDGTAIDAVEQLAASLMAELVPPWSEWFGLRPGIDVPTGERGAVAELLETIARRLQGHFDRSNFAVEIHQCFLDLVTCGTAHLLFEEAPPGSSSAFRFTAVPVAEMFLDGDHGGEITRFYRVTTHTAKALLEQMPTSALPAGLADRLAGDPDRPIEIVEAVDHRAEVWIDGGFVRGTDVVKALCLGARAVAGDHCQDILCWHDGRIKRATFVNQGSKPHLINEGHTVVGGSAICANRDAHASIQHLGNLCKTQDAHGSRRVV